MISIVIPTLDEERALPATLAALGEQDADFEVIVVDGGSTDRTREVAAEQRERLATLHWLECGPGRARQLNTGAARAEGEWLLFLHADTLLPAGALAMIEGLPESIRAGCFRHRFSGNSRLLRMLSWLNNRRFQVTRVAYGDQAPFVRRRLYTEVGGFTDRPMEDVAFGIEVRAHTRPQMLPLAAVTDARKFDQMGHWRALGHAIRLLMRFRLDRDVEGDRFFDAYR